MTTNLRTSEPAEAQYDPERAFDKPWQVEAFATVVALTRRGAFSWTEWVDAFSTVIAEQGQRPDETVTDAYYRQWMTNLQAMLADRVGIADDHLEDMHNRWRKAYLGTPHGSPVELENHVRAPECAPTPHDHDHPMLSRAELARRAVPAFVDPASSGVGPDA